MIPTKPIILSCLIALGGCTTTTMTPSVSEADLLHHNWKLVEIDGEVVNASHQLNHPHLEIGEAMNSNGFSGCNNFMGKAELVDDKFRIEQLLSTKKACAESMMQTESKMLKTLGSWSEIIINDQLLQLKGEHSVTFELSDWKL
ncbi:META domain-containing protein [Thaumasiovibrio sp. DFM-14]|uniref:META domain-containing protein n=1 Tax=Thaumasiovibrio sp. DFM-14 TaxID=3384792 RepID=UPI0039A296D3